MNFTAFYKWRLQHTAVPEGPVWRLMWGVSAGVSFFYLLMEWVFFATKPSFMSTLDGGGLIRVLFLSPIPLVILSAGVCLFLWMATRLIPRARAMWVQVGGLWPGLILASSFLLLLDNFTYTLFRVGVQSTEGGWRYGYLIIFGLFWVWGWRLAMGMLRAFSTLRHPMRKLCGAALVWIVLWGVLLATAQDRIHLGMQGDDLAEASDLPNILLLASDGLSAEHLSVYGYERETMPYIRQFAEKKALICENAFANAVNSGGSVASMLTGKLPTTLRLYYPPEILMGEDAFEHLPGILRQHGYQNLDISMRQFVDAYDLNMLHSFHEANGQIEGASRWVAGMEAGLGMHAGYFLKQTGERLKNRLWHAAGMKDFELVYEMVAGENPSKDLLNDGPRIERLMRLIAEPRHRPFFVHVHLLGTHGPYFHVQNPLFSKGKEQQELFERDFYDDAILEFDGVFENIIQALESSGQLENTVVVLTSDHSKGWGRERIPLLFWFPKGTPARRIQSNVQALDIAPTLLEFLGIAQPEWMEGFSLLGEEPLAQRPIFIAAVNSSLVDTQKWILDESRCPPPFYSLGKLSAVIGERAFTLDLESGDLTVDAVGGHTYPLAEEEMPSLPEARGILLRQLEKSGYEVPVEWGKSRRHND